MSARGIMAASIGELGGAVVRTQAKYHQGGASSRNIDLESAA